MAGLFIDVVVEPEAARNPAIAKKFEEVCPVNIFVAREDGVQINDDELDECGLCELCLEAAPPGQVRIVKLYEQD